MPIYVHLNLLKCKRESYHIGNRMDSMRNEGLCIVRNLVECKRHTLNTFTAMILRPWPWKETREITHVLLFLGGMWEQHIYILCNLLETSWLSNEIWDQEHSMRSHWHEIDHKKDRHGIVLILLRDGSLFSKLDVKTLPNENNVR